MKSQPEHVFRNNGILIGMGLVVLFASIFFTGLSSASHSNADGNANPYTSDVLSGESEAFISKNLYSGPFAILDGMYGVDDTVFLIGSEIPLNSKGTIDFIRPDGKLHHTFPFDGSKSAVNHYFTPVSSSDLQECLDCEFFGTWTISFRSDEGISYASMSFEVINE
jgi:hypothetical protein